MSVAPTRPLDRPMLGIAFMLGFCILAPMGDALAKYLSAFLPVAMLVLTRFMMQWMLLLPLVAAKRQPLYMTPRLWVLSALRAALHVAGLTAMFWALVFLPIAEAIAIAFVMPFFMLLLGKYVLGEDVGRHRLSACAVGFCGTLMVIQPTFAAVGWPALLPLAVALIFSLFMLVTRAIAKEIDPIALQGINGVQASVMILAGLVFLGFDGWRMPEGAELGWLLALGALGTFAHLAMTWSLRLAPSTTLAPMQYLELPVATILGWYVFSDWPNPLALAGIVVTIATGLYIINRENRAGKLPT